MPKGGARENAGRKAPPGGIRQNRSIKLNNEEWQRLQEKAKLVGLSVSEYIRKLAL